MSLHAKALTIFIILCILLFVIPTFIISIVVTIIAIAVLVGVTTKSLFSPIRYSNKQRYLNSDQWKLVRSRILKRDNFSCKRCGNVHRIEVHHLTYIRFGRELPSDLVTLCRDCHQAVHDHHGYKHHIYYKYTWENL
jgi:queuine/archaeosine tRNA-ribosyltransferase